MRMNKCRASQTRVRLQGNASRTANVSPCQTALSVVRAAARPSGAMLCLAFIPTYLEVTPLEVYPRTHKSHVGKLHQQAMTTEKGEKASPQPKMLLQSTLESNHLHTRRAKQKANSTPPQIQHRRFQSNLP